jgi:maleylacetoacetate isomerase
MKLHAYFRSSTSYRLRIALNLKALDYEIVPVNIVKGEQRAPEFLSHNPFAGVPLLQADARDRAQSLAILEWLDEAYPDRPLLPRDTEDRFTARELAYAIATDIHAINNLSALQYLKNEMGQQQDAIDAWYRHWLKKTLVPVEARLAQLGSGDFLFGAPGLFEVVLLPQMYNARRFALDTSAMAHIERIEAVCLVLPEFQRAHPDNQPDTPPI